MSVTPRWPVVLFDFDGTVINTIDLIIASHQHAFTTVLGHPWDTTEVRSWIGRPLLDALREVVPERADELFAVYYEWNHAHQELADNYPGVPELVWDLVAAGVRTGVVTSRRRASTHELLGQIGLDALLPVLVAGDDEGDHKPAPGPIRRALDQLGAAPADAAYVGDALVDVQAATAAGVTALAVTWGAGDPAALAAAGAAHLVATPDDLRALLLPKVTVSQQSSAYTRGSA
jgi:pyrophosphatase PpaX